MLIYPDIPNFSTSMLLPYRRERNLSENSFSGWRTRRCWIYVVEPMLGAVIGARLYETLRSEEQHTQAPPIGLDEALSEIKAER